MYNIHLFLFSSQSSNYLRNKMKASKLNLTEIENYLSTICAELICCFFFPQSAKWSGKVSTTTPTQKKTQSKIERIKRRENHHPRRMKVEEVIGVGGRVMEVKVDVSDVEFCHYSRRNGGPPLSLYTPSLEPIVLLSSLFFFFLSLSAFSYIEKKTTAE